MGCSGMSWWFWTITLLDFGWFRVFRWFVKLCPQTWASGYSDIRSAKYEILIDEHAWMSRDSLWHKIISCTWPFSSGLLFNARWDIHCVKPIFDLAQWRHLRCDVFVRPDQWMSQCSPHCPSWIQASQNSTAQEVYVDRALGMGLYGNVWSYEFLWHVLLCYLEPPCKFPHVVIKIWKMDSDAVMKMGLGWCHRIN